MNQILKHTLLPTLVATTLASINLMSLKPASANDNWIKDIGIGAATGVVTGAITGHNSGIHNAVNGAAAGAAVHAVNGSSKTYHRSGDLLRDAGVGAAAGTVTGAVTGSHHPVSNAIGGAATGALINILDR
ncbi:MAG: hypothetical protein DSM106950_32750 [Stigonema ocellatum SAG 48.90 = DSM 106950]|nr:hypothetical protein [Stigonema ocellatum SAG 48.90 = DSM 106950]